MAKKATQPQVQPQESTELALFPKLNLPSVTAITEEMNASFQTMYTRLEEDIKNLPTDMSDPKNRAAVASYAYRISRTKTALDEAAKNVSGEAKKIVDEVNDERRELRETLDSLRDKARAPLDQWEQKEKNKAERAERELHQLANFRADCAGCNSKELQAILGHLKSEDFPTEAVFGEKAETVLHERQNVAEWLERRIVEEQKREQEAAELEHLRREKAEREAAEAARIAEEERKEREAAEAKRQEQERARIAQEAEEKAIAVRATNYKSALESFARVIDRAATATSWQIVTFIETAEELEITDERYPADKIGELSALRAETVAKLTDISVKRANEEVEAEKQRKREAEEAEARRIKAAQDQAAQAERDRIARDQAAKEKADQERAADLAHRKKINGEAVAGLMKASGLSEKDAQAVVIAIYKEQVPHVAISY